MARKPPPLVNAVRLEQSEAVDGPIDVGSPAWFSWLTGVSSFAFVGAHGNFTAQKERRGQGREYWKAYRHRGGRLYRAYLGKSDELSLERLNAVAAELAGKSSAPMEQPPAPAIPRLPAATAAPDALPMLRLLSTKMAIPAPTAALIPRPRLMRQLDLALSQGQRLVLLSAPPGFGKTTLLVEWLAAGTPAFGVAWVSLDTSDNHLSQFLAYLITALERVDPASGAEAWGLLRVQAEHPPTLAIVTALVNALAAAARRVVVVFDDYHLITEQAIHEAMALLIEHMPPNLHVIMTSRADPPLPLARLRVRRSLAEVRATDLRFTPEETADFFARLHLMQLSPATLTMLETSTEGWAAGLQLAAIFLLQADAHGRPLVPADFSGSHTHVFDYLVDEVFQRQPASLQTFLIQTAILPRLCGPLCAAITGQENAQQRLDELEQANLFLSPLDHRRQWFRYHALFRDFLLEWLDRKVGPDGRALLHRRASAWFEREGLAGEAIDHALSAQAWDDAMRCLEPLMHAEHIYAYFIDWPRWVAAFPDSVLLAHPGRSLRLAWILTFTGHAEAAERLLTMIEAAAQTTGDQGQAGVALVWRAAACYWRRDLRRGLVVARDALDLLPEDAVEQRAFVTHVQGMCYLDLGDTASAMAPIRAAYAALQQPQERFFGLAAAMGMARAAQAQGQLQQAAALYQSVIQRGKGATYLQGPMPYMCFGLLAYEWNDLAQAEALLREGIAVGQHTGRGRYWPNALGGLARVLWAGGDPEQAHGAIEQAVSAAQALGSPRDLVEAEVQRVWLWLAQGDLAVAARWMVRRPLADEESIPYDRQAEALMIARIRIAQAAESPAPPDLAPVLRLLSRMQQTAEADLRLGDHLQILTLRALAHAAGGDTPQSHATLLAALTLAAPAGYLRTFVDLGPPVAALLNALRSEQAGAVSGPIRAYIDHLLAAFGPGLPSNQPGAPNRALLSDRERAILHLLASGESTEAIARTLIISIHTARSHLKNIYAKLEVHNRIQALERARALRLL